MKFLRLDLLTLLISLFILSGCKNQDSIGLGVVSSNQISGSLIDTSTIVINTVAEDSVITNGLSRTPLSYFKDPVFGTTEADIALDINLPNSTAYTLPTGTFTVDSAVLVMNYATSSFYGDSLASRYKANVYQLGERMYSGVSYSSKKTWAVESTLLGTTKTAFRSATSDSVSIVNPVTGGPDTVVKVKPQLRIPLSTSFIRSILYDAPASQLSSNLIFKNNVKGLYVKLDQNQAGPGGTFMFDLDTAGVQVYYRNVNGSVIDTGILTLPSNLHAAFINHTKSATVNNAINSAANSKVVYLQGMGGLRNKISFPYLKNILKTVGGDVVVNRAELVVSIVPGSNIPFATLPKLAMYRYDLANQLELIQDAASSDPRYFTDNASSGFYIAKPVDKTGDPLPGQYHFLITAYIQDLMRGITKDYGTYIGSVIPTTAITVAPTAQVDGRTIAIGADSSSPYHIKLNLYYTKVVK